MGIRDGNIKEILLEPLSALFGRLPEEREKHYLEALKSAPDNDLKSLFSYFRDTHKSSRFPTIAEIQKARKDLIDVGSNQQNNSFSTNPHPWEIRDELVNETVKTFMGTWRRCLLQTQANNEGWGSELLKYTEEVAFVQAQIFHGVKNIGYQSMSIFGISYQRDDIGKQREDAFWSDIRAQMSTGRIEVTLPAWRREQMERTAILTAQQVKISAPSPKPNSPQERTQQVMATAVEITQHRQQVIHSTPPPMAVSDVF